MFREKGLGADLGRRVDWGRAGRASVGEVVVVVVIEVVVVVMEVGAERGEEACW